MALGVEGRGSEDLEGGVLMGGGIGEGCFRPVEGAMVTLPGLGGITGATLAVVGRGGPIITGRGAAAAPAVPAATGAPLTGLAGAASGAPDEDVVVPLLDPLVAEAAVAAALATGVGLEGVAAAPAAAGPTGAGELMAGKNTLLLWCVTTI